MKIDAASAIWQAGQASGTTGPFAAQAPFMDLLGPLLAAPEADGLSMAGITPANDGLPVDPSDRSTSGGSSAEARYGPAGGPTYPRYERDPALDGAPVQLALTPARDELAPTLPGETWPTGHGSGVPARSTEASSETPSDLSWVLVGSPMQVEPDEVIQVDTAATPADLSWSLGETAVEGSSVGEADRGSSSSAELERSEEVEETPWLVSSPDRRSFELPLVPELVLAGSTPAPVELPVAGADLTTPTTSDAVRFEGRAPAAGPVRRAAAPRSTEGSPAADATPTSGRASSTPVSEPRPMAAQEPRVPAAGPPDQGSDPHLASTFVPANAPDLELLESMQVVSSRPSTTEPGSPPDARPAATSVPNGGVIADAPLPYDPWVELGQAPAGHVPGRTEMEGVASRSSSRSAPTPDRPDTSAAFETVLRPDTQPDVTRPRPPTAHRESVGDLAPTSTPSASAPTVHQGSEAPSRPAAPAPSQDVRSARTPDASQASAAPASDASDAPVPAATPTASAPGSARQTPVDPDPIELVETRSSAAPRDLRPAAAQPETTGPATARARTDVPVADASTGDPSVVLTDAEVPREPADGTPPGAEVRIAPSEVLETASDGTETQTPDRSPSSEPSIPRATIPEVELRLDPAQDRGVVARATPERQDADAAEVTSRRPEAAAGTGPDIGSAPTAGTRPGGRTPPPVESIVVPTFEPVDASVSASTETVDAPPVQGNPAGTETTGITEGDPREPADVATTEHTPVPPEAAEHGPIDRGGPRTGLAPADPLEAVTLDPNAPAPAEPRGPAVADRPTRSESMPDVDALETDGTAPMETADTSPAEPTASTPVQTNSGTPATAASPAVVLEPVEGPVTEAFETAPVDTASVETPSVETPSVETAFETPSVETAFETPSVDTAAAELPSLDTASVGTPSVDTAAAELPSVDTAEPPSVETAATETPSIDTGTGPSADTAAAETSSLDTAAVETASLETPSLDPAAAETPSVEPAAVETASVDAASPATPSLDPAAAETPSLDTTSPETAEAPTPPDAATEAATTGEPHAPFGTLDDASRAVADVGAEGGTPGIEPDSDLGDRGMDTLEATAPEASDVVVDGISDVDLEADPIALQDPVETPEPALETPKGATGTPLERVALDDVATTEPPDLSSGEGVEAPPVESSEATHPDRNGAIEPVTVSTARDAGPDAAAEAPPAEAPTAVDVPPADELASAAPDAPEPDPKVVSTASPPLDTAAARHAAAPAPQVDATPTEPPVEAPIADAAVDGSPPTANPAPDRTRPLLTDTSYEPLLDMVRASREASAASSRPVAQQAADAASPIEDLYDAPDIDLDGLVDDGLTDLPDEAPRVEARTAPGVGQHDQGPVRAERSTVVGTPYDRFLADEPAPEAPGNPASRPSRAPLPTVTDPGAASRTEDAPRTDAQAPRPEAAPPSQSTRQAAPALRTEAPSASQQGQASASPDPSEASMFSGRFQEGARLLEPGQPPIRGEALTDPTPTVGQDMPRAANQVRPPVPTVALDAQEPTITNRPPEPGAPLQPTEPEWTEDQWRAAFSNDAVADDVIEPTPQLRPTQAPLRHDGDWNTSPEDPKRASVREGDTSSPSRASAAREPDSRARGLRWGATQPGGARVDATPLSHGSTSGSRAVPPTAAAVAQPGDGVQADPALPDGTPVILSPPPVRPSVTPPPIRTRRGASVDGAGRTYSPPGARRADREDAEEPVESIASEEGLFDDLPMDEVEQAPRKPGRTRSQRARDAEVESVASRRAPALPGAEPAPQTSTQPSFEGASEVTEPSETTVTESRPDEPLLDAPEPDDVVALPPAPERDDRTVRIALDADVSVEVNTENDVVDITVEGGPEETRDLEDLGPELEQELARSGFNMGRFKRRDQGNEEILHEGPRRDDVESDTENENANDPVRRGRRSGRLVDLFA